MAFGLDDAALLALAAVSGGISAMNSSKAAKLRAKETKRETYANLTNEAHNRSAEREKNHLSRKKNASKRKAQISQDSVDTVRGAFNI